VSRFSLKLGLMLGVLAVDDQELEDQLRQSFCQETEEQLSVIEKSLSPSTADLPVPALTSNWSQAFAAAHTVKGSARAVDFPEMEMLGGALEGLFRKATEPNLCYFSSAQLQKISGSVSLLRDYLKAYAAKSKLPKGSRARAALNELEGISPEAPPVSALSQPEPIAIVAQAPVLETEALDQDTEMSLEDAFYLEACQTLEELSIAQTAFGETDELEARLRHAEVAFRSAHSMKGASRAVELSSMEMVSEALEQKWRKSRTAELCSFSKKHLETMAQTQQLLKKLLEAWRSGQRGPKLSEVKQHLQQLESVAPGSGTSATVIQAPVVETSATLSAAAPLPTESPAQPVVTAEFPDDPEELSLEDAFYKEATESFAAIADAQFKFAQLDDLGQRLELARSAFRAAHTIKGSARAVDLASLEMVAEGLESKWRAATSVELCSFSSEALSVLEEVHALAVRLMDSWRRKVKGPKLSEVKALLAKLDEVQAGSGELPTTKSTETEVELSLEELLRETFAHEVASHLPALKSSLAQVGAHAEGPMFLQGLERFYLAATALKGAARAIDRPDIESLCGAIEDVSRNAVESRLATQGAKYLEATQMALRLLEQSAQAYLENTKGPTAAHIGGVVNRLSVQTKAHSFPGEHEDLPVKGAAKGTSKAEAIVAPIDPELLTTFRAEAADYLSEIFESLQELEQEEARFHPEILERIFRDVHSLKGALRSVGLVQPEPYVQVLEDYLSALKRGQLQLNPPNRELLSRSLGQLERLLDPTDPVKPQAVAAIQLEIMSRIDPTAKLEVLSTADDSVVATPSAATTVPVETVRVSGLDLDSLLLSAEEMLFLKGQVRQHLQSTRSVQNSLSEWTRKLKGHRADILSFKRRQEEGILSEEGSSLLEFIQWSTDYIGELEQKLQQQARRQQEDYRAAVQKVDTLLTDSKNLLLSPFTSLVSRYPRQIRELARELKKEVDFQIIGSELQVDRRILEELKDPLLHLLRNAIDHGIESPEVRVRASKNKLAKLELKIEQQFGDQVSLRLKDDGAGIDPVRIRATAVKRGIKTQEQVDAMNDADAISLIFESDFSTTEQANAISGRGLGMAIVREKIRKIGGSLHIDSVVGQGTTFLLTVPLTLASFKGVLVESAGQRLILPALSIQRVVHLKQEKDLRSTPQGLATDFEGIEIPVVRLEHVLGVQSLHEEKVWEGATLVVIEALSQKVALWIDSIEGEIDVVSKALPFPYDRLMTLSGVTVLSDARIVPIARITHLVEVASKRNLSVTLREQPVKKATQKVHVLLADDSLTSRTLLRNLLVRAGYRVTAVADGMQALQTAQAEGAEFDLVVSDVEMPNMNGLDFVTNLRALPKFQQTPVIFVTTLDKETDRQKGLAVGANAYIIKGSLRKNQLVDTVKQFLPNE
jgi:two-component system, chemotaxis family, sensor kinase CheA